MFPADVCGSERAQAALLLRQYCSRVIVESRPGISMAQLERQARRLICSRALFAASTRRGVRSRLC